MCSQEITGVVINSNYVTNDPSEIDVASVTEQSLEYVSGDQTRHLARNTGDDNFILATDDEETTLFVRHNLIRQSRALHR